MGAAATASLTRRLFTPEEYLSLDRAADLRSEFYAGEIFAMAGGSHAHSVLIDNLTAGIRPAVRKRGCRTHPSTIRVGMNPRGGYFYPDLTVAREEPKLLGNDTLLNPVLVVEVSSRSTARFDREIKLKEYQSVASMREVLLVSQDRQHIEVHSRQGKEWSARTFTKSDGEIRIPYFDCAITLAEIYDGVW
ncbi:MAG: Uma2 family endonuclease [Bryobacteraceae bacterium]